MMRSVWYEGVTNSDRTEGRGTPVRRGKFLTLTEAVDGVRGIGVQGMSGDVVRCTLEADEQCIPYVKDVKVWAQQKGADNRWRYSYVADNLTEAEKAEVGYTDEVEELREQAAELGFHLVKA